MGEQLASKAGDGIVTLSEAEFLRDIRENATLKTEAVNSAADNAADVTFLVLKTLQGSLNLLELCNNS